MNKTTLAGIALVILTSMAGAALAEEGGGNAPRAHGGGGKFLKQLDTNHDGNVTEGEFGAGSAAKATQMFNKLDSDGNGQVSRSEFDSQAPAMAGKAFGRMDKNSDGVINKADRPNGGKGKVKLNQTGSSGTDGGVTPIAGGGEVE